MPIVNSGVMLDTNVVIRHLRNATSLLEKLSAFSELFLPLPVLAELYSGAFRSARPDRKLREIDIFSQATTFAAPDEKTAFLYGEISARLAKKGNPIPQNDIWIAALALQFDLPLATADDHFSKVDGLEVLLW